MTAPLPPHTPETRRTRLRELLLRYLTFQRQGKWYVRDGETGEVMPPEYVDETHAKRGAREFTAFDIEDLYAGAPT